MNRFFYEDGLGVVTSIKKAMSVEDKKAEKMMEESAVIVDGHYEIGMLWKTEDSQLPLKQPRCCAQAFSTPPKSPQERQRVTYEISNQNRRIR